MMKIQYPIIIFIAVFLSLTVGCGSNSDNNTYNIEVLSAKRVCYSMVQGLCIAGKIEDNNQEIIRNYWSIEGLNFQWGTAYEITIQETVTPNPPADGPDREYKVIRMIDSREDPLGTLYSYSEVMMSEFTITRENNEYHFIGKPFACESEQDCEGLLALNSSGGNVNLTFEYLGDGEIRLVNWN